jgi:hypothetical protein
VPEIDIRQNEGQFGSPMRFFWIVVGSLTRRWSLFIQDDGAGLQPFFLFLCDVFLGRCPRLVWIGPSALWKCPESSIPNMRRDPKGRRRGTSDLNDSSADSSQAAEPRRGGPAESSPGRKPGISVEQET